MLTKIVFCVLLFCLVEINQAEKCITKFCDTVRSEMDDEDIYEERNGDEITKLEKKLNYKIELMHKDFNNKLAKYKEKIEVEIKNNKQSTCDSDWVSYSDSKCYKVLEKKGSESEAKTNCSQLDKSSTLITIQSKGEQKFVENYLKLFHNISSNIWIGLEYINKTYKWMDGIALNYENWDENAVKDGTNKCVQMTIAEANLGQWMDDLCNKKFLIVCQKKQSSKTILNEEITNITKVIEKQQNIIKEQQNDIKLQQNDIKEQQNDIKLQQNDIKEQQNDIKLQQNDIKEQQNDIKEQQKQINEINSKESNGLKNIENKINSLIPLGFLYTQFPDQSTPQQLWPNMKWIEVTQYYSGLFFRAEGSGSLAFGKLQEENFSRITQCKMTGWQVQGGYAGEVKTINFNVSDWTALHASGVQDWLSFYTTGGENRPRNTAIKIWKRIE